ncbi:MAG TPA: cytochrome b N-terminal domain-containing protein [Candidatus Acidoferrum sp.]|nr:cytochrome b N-terminal domain-containing protein [Candidatus Acidoferrum sp.]
MSLKPVLERIGWEKALQPFLFKKLSAKTGWSATLGSLCVMLFLVQAVTGIFLALYYNPSPDKAYQSVDYIMQDVPLGTILRGLHHWGASAMVIAVVLHLLSNFFAGSYKAPREATWIGGVCLLLFTLGLGFTGYLLPWDMKSYWATVVSTNIPRDVPVVGGFVTHLALGGDTVSGATLTRFYAVHAMLLPALLLIFAVSHIYLVRVHGLAEEPAEVVPGENSTKPDLARSPSGPLTRPEGHPLPIRWAEGGGEGSVPGAPILRSKDAKPAERQYRFYPEHAWRSAVLFAVVFLGLIALSLFGHIPREPVAGTLVPDYLPRPEWYYLWLFQLLTYFPGKWEVLGSLVVPILALVLLFALPFLGRNRRLGVANRPLALAVGVTGIVGVVYLTAQGFAGVRAYGQVIPVPNRALSATEKRGLFLYADRDCAYCHQINGVGGHRVGPDLANMAAKRRSKEYLARYIKDPQAIKPTAIMPKYDLPQADLDALADFVLSLDFSRYAMKAESREDALKP